MSDELVKRLREDQPVTQDMVSTMQCALQDAAADRIEELEADLEKAVRLISEKPILATYEDDVQWQKYVIAELKGGKDE